MRKKNLTKAVESTIAPNPKEVDIWVEPKDDDTVSLKYYDYHDEEWKGDGENNLDFPLLHFYDGTGVYSVLDLKNNLFHVGIGGSFCEEKVHGITHDGILEYYVDFENFWNGLRSLDNFASKINIEIRNLENNDIMLKNGWFAQNADYYVLGCTSEFATSNILISVYDESGNVHNVAKIISITA